MHTIQLDTIGKVEKNPLNKDNKKITSKLHT